VRETRFSRDKHLGTEGVGTCCDVHPSRFAISNQHRTLSTFQYTVKSSTRKESATSPAAHASSSDTNSTAIGTVHPTENTVHLKF
jgi:hypothetical protein